MPAAKALQVRPLTDQPGQQVLVLGQLDLDLALTGASVPSEHVQDQRGTVDDFDLESRFQVALLGGRQFIIADHHVGSLVLQQILELLEFALAQIGRSDALRALGYGGDHLGAGRPGQVIEFDQRVVEAPEALASLLGFHGNQYRPLGLRAGGFGLT